MSNVDCHIFPAGESASSIVAPLTRGSVASSVAGAIVNCELVGLDFNDWK